MQEVFEKIIEKLKSEAKRWEDSGTEYKDRCEIAVGRGLRNAIEIVKQKAEQYNNGWIPVSEKLPPVETEVYITAKRKYKDGSCKYIVTTAMYEDGNVMENDSCWHWENIDGDWDEENDCYIIPEGWWENRHYNPDAVLNNAVDDEVLAWMPLPQPYQRKGE